MANQGPQSETRLVCIDFDDTIVNGHCHGTLIDLGFVPRNRANGIRDEGVQIIQNGNFTNQVTNQSINGVSLNARGEQLNDARIQQILMGNHQINNDHRVAGFKNGPAMRDAIREALKNGNKVAITSFTLYPEVLKPALAMIGLTAQEINQVCIVGGYPKDGPNSANGKQEHIEAAMQHFQITQKENVMLVDDSTNNIRIASSKGMQTQNVPKYRDPDPAYFESINQFVSVRPSVRAQNSPQPLAPQQNSPTMGTQAQQPTGPLFYQANQISGQLAKLNQQSLTQWETRPGQSNSVSQFVSPPLSKDQAEKLLSQINPALKGAIYPTHDGSAHRVVINIQEAVKLNPNVLFSKNAQIQAQNQNINPNVQTSSNVQTQFTAPPRSPLGQLPPTPKVAPQVLKDAVQFLRTGDYQSIPALKDLKFARGIENYSFDISQQNGAFFAHINSEYGNENKTIPLSAADIQTMANIARASMGAQATTPNTPVAASSPIPPIPNAAPVVRQPQQVSPTKNFVQQAIDAVEQRYQGENKRIPQLKELTISQLNRINASNASPQQKEAQALHYLQAQAENNHYAWNALQRLGKPTSAPHVAPVQQPVAQPAAQPMPPVATNMAQPRAVSPHLGTIPPSPIRGPTPQPPDAATRGPTSRPLPQPQAQSPARAPVIYDSSLGLNAAVPQPMVFGSQAAKLANHGPVAQSAAPTGSPNLPPPTSPATNNYVQFSQVTNQQRAANIPPVDQKLVQEANQIDALKAIFDTPITTLKGQYESFSKAKHASENQGMLHSFAKSIAKSVSGIAKERNQQVNDISQALQAIKNAPNLNALDKATLAYAHLESAKAAMGSGKSGIKDLCDSLVKQIESAVPGAKDNYHSNAMGHIGQAEDIVGKIKDTQQPSNNKPR